MGHGKASDLARMVKPGLDLIGHVSARHPVPPRPQRASSPENSTPRKSPRSWGTRERNSVPFARSPWGAMTSICGKWERRSTPAWG
ncbi:MAG: hypothetical protein ABSG54_03420 [Terriglobia bacterium]